MYGFITLVFVMTSYMQLISMFYKPVSSIPTCCALYTSEHHPYMQLVSVLCLPVSSIPTSLSFFKSFCPRPCTNIVISNYQVQEVNCHGLISLIVKHSLCNLDLSILWYIVPSRCKASLEFSNGLYPSYGNAHRSTCKKMVVSSVQ